MLHQVACALAVAVALLALPASAALVSVDLLAPGDGLITRDTDTGLDWLDLGGVTTNLSYDQVIAGAGGWTSSGWRHATRAQVCALFVAHAGVPTCTSDNLYGQAPPDTISFSLMVSTTGETPLPDFTRFVRGVYADDTNPSSSVGVASLDVGAGGFPPVIFRVQSSAVDDAAPSSEALPTRGHFLVRTTPPSVPALPLAGAAALAALLAFAARRMRAS